MAGQLAALRELTLMFAPNVNSYKRFVAGSFAPTAVAWGKDNRTCSMRVVGHGQGLRVENRLPGADVNPYLALAAMIAAGLHGIDNELPLEPAFEGNAYDSDKPKVPHTMYAARDLFAESDIAREAFGAGRGRALPQPGARSSWTPTRPPSPTGRSSAASSVCEPPRNRHLRGHRAGLVGRLGGGRATCRRARTR